MLNKLKCYGWVIVFVLIACPHNTAFARSDTPTAGQIWKEPVTGMEFVWVPKGCYEMGCGSWADDCNKDEKPAHEVCLDGFWMGKTEVTQGQWKQIMRNNPAKFQKGDNYPVEKYLLGRDKEVCEEALRPKQWYLPISFANRGGVGVCVPEWGETGEVCWRGRGG
jgi:formylglycine-generating enzyme required for sulfatase activity